MRNRNVTRRDLAAIVLALVASLPWIWKDLQPSPAERAYQQRVAEVQAAADRADRKRPPVVSPELSRDLEMLANAKKVTFGDLSAEQQRELLVRMGELEPGTECETPAPAPAAEGQ